MMEEDDKEDKSSYSMVGIQLKKKKPNKTKLKT